jgi:hypothetical protein
MYQKNNNMSDKTVLKTNQVPTAGQRKIRFNNLTTKQKSRLSAAMIGIGGISLGALAMTLMGKVNTPTEDNKNDVNDKGEIDNVINRKTGEEEMEIPVFLEAPFAESINGDMSFGEAFGAARVEVGPGGFFEWNGNTYNTYYKEEWDALPPEEQKEFYASVDDDKGKNETKEDTNENDNYYADKDKDNEVEQEELIVINEEEILDILNDDEKNSDIFDGGEEDIVIAENDDYYDIVVIEEDGDDDIVVIDDDEIENGNEDDGWVVEENDIDIDDLG